MASGNSGGLPPAPTEIGLPPDWLVIAPADGQRLYRLIGGNFPKIRDFKSDRSKGRPRLGEDLEADHLGLSMFATEDQAMSMARRYPKRVAEVVLERESGIGLARTLLDLPGHYTVWAQPEDLLDRISSVTRQDEE